ncbi:Guanine nucleotide exchange factor lte1 [Exophiala dermatitidis]|uniref:Gdp/GTP exchange factor n=2 Tax=Exophiala dermatitidis TaxID=5970 RepID=H6BSW8_EXODN|nr:gdp/GTP exchange factor [Exophiala dermatitidis NIH/UT8656]KAJ4505862.1 Guanine nucleotide exchange factor lte1 [Exophiala dermatitidis]EHY54272.1 gdp/GTP exchange factor [Exophiala dermatitidis NIH/UT8656]KAJ4508010.1 Guanine nucleotide exchange factor lte1 [Exophiala dermatitidis]KAJ4513581.1 Guanine nucleotide exchange factor lte1 [Exophiala dermatitidis]KAJ4535576.1 Guanine nucleotide exchange factor lte1 [Exophiala dermatitidis]
MAAMVSDSTVSSHVSLISLDPVLASHITGATTLPATSQHGSSPQKSTQTPDTARSRRHFRNNSAPVTAHKKRSNSLRRAKNSTEVLRQRSIKSGKKTKPLETIPDNKEGRTFTIGNVGTGGILYLTPSTHQVSVPHQTQITSPIVLTVPSTAPAFLGDGNLAVLTESEDTSNPSEVFSQPHSSSPIIRSRRFSTRLAPGAQHGRSQSCSTVEERRQSASAMKSRTLKIVINRPDGSREPTDANTGEENKKALPTLEVPIPHYRIGTFRFSSHGTPVLRSSSYTRGSATPSDVTPTPGIFHGDSYFGGVPMSGLRMFASTEVAQAQDSAHIPPAHQETVHKSTSRAVSTVTNPAEPKLFDDLNAVYDDPSVVRYCQNVREITAATPARIIAQISSDSFMDYELVSDFFLTFRSYMSTYEVLDLLLARLRWAIGRMEEDGRIIRVRTFAALRHWILNYFMDDFYPDRRLRERFCEEINRLYADVKASPQHGFSDLKLLRDLKRCWIGRCSLCWDPAQFQLDGEQEEDIQPGDTVDLDDTPTPRVSTRLLHAQPETRQSEVLRGPHRSWFEADLLGKPQHSRQESGASRRDPNSMVSDGSVQATSCFVPKQLLKITGDGEVHCKGPHLVSVQQRRRNAPANLHVTTHPASSPKLPGHKRGASSIDSNREPTPQKTDLDSSLAGTEDGAIIRGLLYSPSAPFVQIVSPGSTQSLDRHELGIGMRETPKREHGTHLGTHPIGRNIFGSLRKVLGSKNGPVNMTFLTVSQSEQGTSVRGHRAHLPINISKSHDELHNKTGTAMARKAEIRIDLLCAAVCQNYESKFPTKRRITYGPLYASDAPFQPTALGEEESRTPRQVSQATAESGSILIVDDTGVEGVDPSSLAGGIPSAEDGTSGQALETAPDHAPQTSYHQAATLRGGSLDAVVTQRSSNALGDRLDTLSVPEHENPLESAAVAAPEVEAALEDRHGSARTVDRPVTPTTASSKTVRDDAELLDIPGQPARASADHVPIVLSRPQSNPKHEGTDSDGPSEPKTPSHMPSHRLRRRPGGDLRLVENVQELDHAMHHASVDTSSIVSHSSHESLLIMKTDKVGQGIPPDAGPPNRAVSMINTHSSQHLRPSFEAAIAGFSAIPDDDDGGLEATLLKLEGRYEKKSPPLDQHPIDTTGRRRSLPDLGTSHQRDYPLSALPDNLPEPISRPTNDEIQATVNEVGSDSSSDDLPIETTRVVETEQQSPRRSSIYGLPTESVAGSEESYNSLPLLRRPTGPQSAGPSLILAAAPQPPATAPGYYAQDPPQLFHLPKGPPASVIKHHHSLVRPSTANESEQSFLLDEDENLSDLSSEISVDIINHAEPGNRSISPMLAAPGTAISGLEIPAHPLTYASVVNLNIPEENNKRSSDPVPPFNPAETSQIPPPSFQQPPIQESPPLQPLARLPAGPAHVPFVLACDSQVLAQQMTLVEKSALCEVEWSDLVEMRWNNKAADVLDWVECLARGDITGIDLVITRFNLVVKWALSEIVLTQDIHERARVITKFIHVAAHARRLHNYATMLQLTIALTSTDCTRLTQTWDMVADPDKSLLKHMEALVQPVRNFHDLRLEMESADLSDGCIPFIGLYIHDLTYNAQKPSHIQVGHNTEPLVNFERYRTTAVIVKGLLRLIDASSRYTFEPISGIIERCLWLAALSDEQIRNASQMLEPGPIVR